MFAGDFMSETRVVSDKVAAMFLVILMGWLARRRGHFGEEFTSRLSHLVVDIALPMMVFTQMLRSVDRASLARGWIYPLVCCGIFIIAYFAGKLTVPFFCAKEERRTYLFLTMIPNWVFLPLPIAEELYGNEGVQFILLCNVGAQVLLWTFCLWVLHGKIEQASRNILSNTGIWATAAGIVFALLFPSARQWGSTDPSTASVGSIFIGSGVQALTMVGSLTIPLSLFAIGAQLGGLTIAVHRLPRVLWGVLVSRLVVGPLLTIAILAAMTQLGFSMSHVTQKMTILIAAMPVAISCSVMAERFQGDTQLAAQGIFYSTFFSLLTIPGLFYLIEKLHL